MPVENALARRPSPMATFLKLLFSQSSISMAAGAVLISLIRLVWNIWSRWRAAKSELLWRRRVDLDVVQACIMTTEHLQSLGRIEKRTLFVKPVSEVFRNEYILARILSEAEESAESKDPMLVSRLTREDKWHVLATCANHLSSCFAPYHVFFNEARRTESYYKSAWYCFTLTCGQTAASGRWFITPNKPVGKGDVGTRRIRIVMMNEEELRDVASGVISPPHAGMFNQRHEARWNVVSRFADLFQRQLSGATGSSGNSGSSAAQRKVIASSLPALSSLESDSCTRSDSLDCQREQAEDNAILRLHVPFPASKHGRGSEPVSQLEECVAKDVVLYE